MVTLLKCPLSAKYRQNEYVGANILVLAKILAWRIYLYRLDPYGSQPSTHKLKAIYTPHIYTPHILNTMIHEMRQKFSIFKE